MSHKITMKTIAKSINPEWEFEQWLNWPPDMFALISTVLNRSGAYRFCLINQGEAPWDQPDWQNNLAAASDIWIDHAISNILDEKKSIQEEDFLVSKLTNPDIKEHTEKIKKYWEEFSIDEIRIIDDSNFSLYSKEIIDFIISLIVVFAMADLTGRALGSIGQDANAQKKKLKLFHALANLLLNNKGSLSTISKSMGIVVPKMRTPQTGVVFRGLSLYLTFHITEVEVAWRTLPLVNNNRLNLNILVCPWPLSITESSFESKENINHPTNYFNITHQKDNNTHNREKDKKNDIENFINRLIGHIANKNNPRNYIDMVIFPEMALTDEWHQFLLAGLQKIYKNTTQLPIIISGVLKKNANQTGRFDKFSNELRISVYFAGKWYNITQSKHHRWLLDKNQIRQYKIENVLSTEKSWYENIMICQKKLSILAPNGWMALSCLICEDLARQEPIGEIIRGIGPTLLFALLSDGPQLINRWSARYASTLADDPGTAVLSVTSKGMAERSVRYDQHSEDKTKSSKTIVGLWKDMFGGYKELGIEDGYDAIGFTISAKIIEEFSLDRRTDGINASAFKMDSLDATLIEFDPVSKDPEREEKSTINSEPAIAHSKPDLIAEWYDIRDLSALLFAFDSILDLLSVDKKILSLKEDEEVLTLTEAEKHINFIMSRFPSLSSSPTSDKTNQLIYQIDQSWKGPEQLDQVSRDKKNHADKELQIAIPIIRLLIKKILNLLTDEKQENSIARYYSKIVELCGEEIRVLNRSASSREVTRAKQIPYAVCLTLINAKTGNWKSRRDFKSENNLRWQDVVDLKEKIIDIFKKDLPSIHL